MKKLIIIPCLIIVGLTSKSQIWTDPVVINPWQSQLYSDHPDFCIDNAGIIHCVWRTKHGTNIYCIWYSKSGDEGETWSTPYNVSQNNSLWMSNPHVVSDSSNHIHITYDYDIGNYGNIKILYKNFNGINWSTADTISKGFVGAMNSILSIDNENHLYCFWYIGGPSTGNIYYRKKDIGNDIWSDVYNPYDSALFIKVIVGKDNSFNILGRSFSQTEAGYKIAYFKYDNNSWSNREIVSPTTISNISDISLDNELAPHIIWEQYSFGNLTGIDSSLYRFKGTSGWQDTDFITSNSDHQAIIIDKNNDLIIVEVEKINNIFYLNEYTKVNDQWEMNIIDENNFTFYGNRLILRNSFIYFINIKVDSSIGSQAYTNLIFRKKEIITVANAHQDGPESSLKIFPNPSNQFLNFSFSISKPQSIKAKIINLRGLQIKSLYDGIACTGELHFAWDGTYQNGERAGKGIYMIYIKTEIETITKKIIMN